MKRSSSLKLKAASLLCAAISVALVRPSATSAATGSGLGVNAAESLYCASALQAPKCITAFPYRDVAILATVNYYGQTEQSNQDGRANAFQHGIWILWTAWSVKDPGFAYAIGYYHEYPWPTSGEGYYRSTMDLHNDGFGVNGATPAVLNLSFNGIVGSVQPVFSALANQSQLSSTGSWTNPSKMWRLK